MGRLFLRIFLWFWLATTSLLLVLAISAQIGRPDAVGTWRSLGLAAMLRLGTQAADAFEQQGVAHAESVLADTTRDVRARVWLYDANGHSVGPPAPLADPRELVTRALRGDEVERSSRIGTFLLAHRVASSTGQAFVFIWESPFQLRMDTPGSRARFSLRVLATILTAGVVCWWLTWQITRPIRSLRAAARRYSQGDLAVRIGGQREFKRGDELTELAREFDYMAARIEDLVTSQQQLLADISHELRSPLARLSLALDLARRRLGDEVPEHHRMAREVQRLDELIEQLLTLARLRGQAQQSPQAQPEPVDLRDIVRDVAQDARFEAESTGRTVVVAAECDATLAGHRALLRSALENVVRNAVRHTPEGGEVALTMRREDEQASQTPAPSALALPSSLPSSFPLPRVAIVVRDRGPGVPPHTLDRLFDPFYRVDEARDRTSGGLGLGLAIARQAMLAHGGTATARNHPDGGLEVRLELPVQTEATAP